MASLQSQLRQPGMGEARPAVPVEQLRPTGRTPSPSCQPPKPASGSRPPPSPHPSCPPTPSRTEAARPAPFPCKQRSAAEPPGPRRQPQHTMAASPPGVPCLPPLGMGAPAPRLPPLRQPAPLQLIRYPPPLAGIPAGPLCNPNPLAMAWSKLQHPGLVSNSPITSAAHTRSCRQVCGGSAGS